MDLLAPLGRAAGAQGRPPSAEELCPDDPELQARLRDRIRQRERIEAMLQPSTVAEPTGRTADRPPPRPSPATRSWRCSAAAAWASSTRPGTGRSNRVVALKMILAGRPRRTPSRRRFRAEAEAVARLQHPNIVQIYEVGEPDGRPFFALEFVAGGRLAGAARRRRRGRPARRPRWSQPLAGAVRHAHAHGRRPPRPQAGQRPADRRRRRPRSPTSAWPSGWTPTAGRRRPARSWARPATWPPSRPRATPRTSARRPTSTPWGRSSTSC